MFIVGIDVAKRNHEAAIITSDGEMERLSSWARLDMMVMSSSPLLSSVQR